MPFMSSPGIRGSILVTVVALLLVAVVIRPATSLADHESTTVLTFAPLADAPSPDAEGTGVVDYHGGGEPDTRWTATFQFTELATNAPYAVVVQGRYGEDGSEEAEAFSQICTFTTDGAGGGGCWYYFVGLKRLGVAQLRVDTADGPAILQASAAADEPGAMDRTANAFSPTATALVATPDPATPLP